MNGLVDDVLGAPFTHLAKVLANPVCHHDGVVEGITDNRQQRRQDTEIKRPLEQRKHTQHDDDVVGQGHNRGNAKFELEPHANVNQHNCQRDEHTQATVFLQLVANLGADKFGAHQLKLVTTGRQRGRDFSGQLVVLGLCHSHQHRGIRTKVLDHELLVSRALQGLANIVQGGCLLVFQLNGGTTGKIQPEVQAAHCQQRNGRNNQRNGHNGSYLPKAHKIDRFLLYFRHWPASPQSTAFQPVDRRIQDLRCCD